MPCEVLAFRPICGSFIAVFINFMKMRADKKKKMFIRVVSLRHRLAGIVMGFVLAYLAWANLILLCANDVELNPGPVEGREGPVLRQTNIRQACSKTRASSTSGSGSGSPSVDMAVGEDRRISGKGVGDSGEQLTLFDVMAKLNSMDTCMKAVSNNLSDVKTDVQCIKEKVGKLQSEVEGLKSEVGTLQEENRALRLNNDTLMQRLCNNEKHIDDLENRSRRNNLVFYGMDKWEGENSDSCESRLRELCVDKLDLIEDIEFDRVHRLGNKPNAPLIARCSHYKDKIKILKARYKLKGSGIFVGEDFSSGVREVRKKLAHYAKEKKSMGQ